MNWNIKIIFCLLPIIIFSCKSPEDSKTKDNSSATSEDNQAPSNPSNVLLTASDSKINISWNNPYDVDFSHVEIYRSKFLYYFPYYNIDEEGEAELKLMKLIYTGRSTFYQDNGLKNYELYYYYFFSYDYVGNYSNGLIDIAKPFIPISQYDLIQLNEAYVEGQDGQYLGSISNEFNQNSIFNTNGTYGSLWSRTSIWNVIFDYGNSYSNYSAFNESATNPPKIKKMIGYNFVSELGFLTTNDSFFNRIDPRSLEMYAECFPFYVYSCNP